MEESTIENIQEQFDLDPDELEVDFSQLDVEWGRQGALLDKYLKACAYCSKLTKKAHERLKFIRSELVLDVTKDPEGCLGPKMKATNPNVEAYYRTDKGYIAAKDEWIEAEYIQDLVEGQKSKAYNRKVVLQEAAKLSMLGWFSSPLEPRSLEDLVSKIKAFDDKKADTIVREAVEKKRVRRRRRT